MLPLRKSAGVENVVIKNESFFDDVRSRSTRNGCSGMQSNSNIHDSI